MMAKARRTPGRKSKTKVPKVSEAQIHMTVAEYLSRFAKPGVYWFHPANGEKRDAITGARLKRMGVRPGVPDFVMLHDGKAKFLELKTTGGRLSSVQVLAMEEIKVAGGIHAVAKSIDEAIAVLTTWGAVRGLIQARAA